MGSLNANDFLLNEIPLGLRSAFREMLEPRFNPDQRIPIDRVDLVSQPITMSADRLITSIPTRSRNKDLRRWSLELRDEVNQNIPDDGEEFDPYDDSWELPPMLAPEKRFNPDQPRDPDGKWTSGSSMDADKAQGIVDSLRSGGSPNIRADEMGPFLKATTDEHDKNPVSLSNLRVDGQQVFGRNNLGISRSSMPQIPSSMREQYLRDTMAQGIPVSTESVSPLALRASQSEVSVGGAASNYETMGGYIPTGRHILVSQDNYIIDGHHFWSGAVATALDDPNQRISVIRIGLPITDALAQANQWSSDNGIKAKALGETTYKRWSELIEERDFNPDQPRDEDGKWTSSGDDSATKDVTVYRAVDSKAGADATRAGALGHGILGKAVYVATNPEDVKDWVKGSGGFLMKGTLSSSANIVDSDNVPPTYDRPPEDRPRDPGDGDANWSARTNGTDGVVLKGMGDNVVGPSNWYAITTPEKISWEPNDTPIAPTRSGKIDYRYSPDQPRDEEGKWASSGGTPDANGWKPTMTNAEADEWVAATPSSEVLASIYGMKPMPDLDDVRWSSLLEERAFNPDQPRDHTGKWTGGGDDSGKSKAGPVGGLVKNFAGDPWTPNMIGYDHLVDDGKGGYKFDDYMQARIDARVDAVTQGVPSHPEGERTATILGGGPGSGKSTAINDPAMGTPTKGEAVIVDADHEKEALPEYQEMGHSGDPGAANAAHELSSYIAKSQVSAAIANGQDYLLDGTGNRSAASVDSKIAMARNAGYTVNGLYVTAPIDVAAERAVSRAAAQVAAGGIGRNVPDDILNNTHVKLSQIIPDVANHFDSFKLVDSTNTKYGDPAYVIAQTTLGQPMQVNDQAAYQAFLDKGKAPLLAPGEKIGPK